MYYSKSEQFIKPMQLDIEQERLVAGITTEGEGKTFKGCFIGCSVREYDSALMAKKIQWPEQLVKISERIFEGISPGDKKAGQAFAVDVLKAASRKDVTLVHWQFLHWLVDDVLQDHGTVKVREGCSKALDCLRRASIGEKVEQGEWSAAAAAAYAAYAATYAADAAAAAYAAYAATKATKAAAAAAYAAAAAADAADADAPYINMRDKLLELLEAAPEWENTDG